MVTSPGMPAAMRSTFTAPSSEVAQVVEYREPVDQAQHVVSWPHQGLAVWMPADQLQGHCQAEYQHRMLGIMMFPQVHGALQADRNSFPLIQGVGAEQFDGVGPAQLDTSMIQPLPNQLQTQACIGQNVGVNWRDGQGTLAEACQQMPMLQHMQSHEEWPCSQQMPQVVTHPAAYPSQLSEAEADCGRISDSVLLETPDDATTQVSASEPGPEDCDLEEAGCGKKLTTSASRRLRRRRAGDRCMKAEPKTVRDKALGPLEAGPCDIPKDNPKGKRFTKEFFAELEQKLAGDSKSVENAVAMISGYVWHLSCDPVGCRKVQSALEKASRVDAAKLVAELHGHVWEAATSPHANHVLQKIVTQLTFNAARFVAEEMLGIAANVARHRFGCRILCRLLEFSNNQKTVLKIVEELLQEADDLCRHSFGHHVLQSVMEHGHEQHKGCLVQVLLSDLLDFAKQRHSSYLVETALQHSAPEDQESLLFVLSQPGIIVDLALEGYGSYVAKALLRHPKVDAQAAMDQISRRRPELQATKHGQRLLAELGVA